MKSGADPKYLADPKPLLDAVKSAFPKWATFLGDHGIAGLSFIVNDMEEEVLQTIVESINDPGIDKGHIQAAREIVSGVNKFVEFGAAGICSACTKALGAARKIVS